MLISLPIDFSPPAFPLCFQPPHRAAATHRSEFALGSASKYSPYRARRFGASRDRHARRSGRERLAPFEGRASQFSARAFPTFGMPRRSRPHWIRRRRRRSHGDGCVRSGGWRLMISRRDCFMLIREFRWRWRESGTHYRGALAGPTGASLTASAADEYGQPRHAASPSHRRSYALTVTSAPLALAGAPVRFF